MTAFAYIVEGLDDLSIDTRQAQAAARMAINRTARDTRAVLARGVLQQVNLPASYVSPSQGRLAVTKQARSSDLEARITARGRATSLARFARSGSPGSRGGVHLSVKPGRATYMRRAFLIRLRAGNADLDTKSNLGLAMRLRPGERITNKNFAVQSVSKGLYLLYGPSVSQIIMDNAGSGLAEDMQPKIMRDLQSEILRLMDL